MDSSVFLTIRSHRNLQFKKYVTFVELHTHTHTQTLLYKTLKKCNKKERVHLVSS